MGRTDDERCRAASVPAAARLAEPCHPACAATTWNTAHWQDARTALNAIRGFAELMLAGSAGPLSADGLDYMRQIAAAGRMLEEALSMVAMEDLT